VFATSHGTTLRPPRFKDLTTGNTYEPNKGGGGVIWWPQRQMAGLSGWHMGLVLMREICTQCVFRRNRPHVPVLDRRMQWLWQTPADQVGATRVSSTVCLASLGKNRRRKRWLAPIACTALCSTAR